VSGSVASVERLWGLTGGDPAPTEGLTFSGPEHVLESPFAVTESAATSIGAAMLAAAELLAARDGPSQQVTIDRAHASAAFAADRLLRLDGEAVPSWAPLSGGYRTRDGRYIQLHCNFPHHAQGVADLLGVPLERDAFEAAILEWDAVGLESALIEAGMVGAAYRTLDEWAAHPHALATADLPPLELSRFGDADIRPAPAATRPLEGLRVLDCSRVLAGPVAGMTLASHGADVLRVGAAHLPTVESGVLSTGFGKRNCHVDLRTDQGKATFRALLGEADVLIDAFRPGALAGHGFGPDEVAAIRPGIVVVQLCAFDWVGPWGGRRGFDSIIQSTTGIALAAAGEDGRPRHLPVQALDYATGYLAAFAAMRALARRQVEGGSWLARLSLLRTRNWLVGLGPGGTPESPVDLDQYTHEVDSDFGRLRAVRPLDALPASPPGWERPPERIGSSAPEWV
jgi:crotonobetainyl-CoA:carnitine CoA-transferase CaiB-like acyl-CoA transferase